jgi:hypothetical protein
MALIVPPARNAVCRGEIWGSLCTMPIRAAQELAHEDEAVLILVTGFLPRAGTVAAEYLTREIVDFATCDVVDEV